MPVKGFGTVLIRDRVQCECGFREMASGAGWKAGGTGQEGGRMLTQEMAKAWMGSSEKGQRRRRRAREDPRWNLGAGSLPGCLLQVDEGAGPKTSARMGLGDRVFWPLPLL